MSNIFVFLPKDSSYLDTAVTPTPESYEGGEIYRFDANDPGSVDAANRIVNAGAGFDVSQLVSALITVLWSNVQGKPANFTPSAHVHDAADTTTGEFADGRISESSVTRHAAALLLAQSQITGLVDALAAKIAAAEKGVAGGVATLGGTGFVPVAQIPNLSAAKITSGKLADTLFDASNILQFNNQIAPEFANVQNKPDTAVGFGITDVYTKVEVDTALGTKADASTLGALASKDTLTTADLDAGAVTEDRLSASVQEKLNRSAKNDFAASRAPTSADDAGAGWSPGSVWIDTSQSPHEVYRCVVATLAGAQWVHTSVDVDDLGDMAFQDSSAVAITGGSIDVGVLRVNGNDVFHTGNFDPSSKADAIHVHAIATAVVDGFMSAADKGKLDGIEENAKDDQTGAEIRALLAAEADTNIFTDAMLTKLGGIQDEATKNETDAHLKSRANHTGQQAIETVTNLRGELDSHAADIATKLNASEAPYASVAQFTSNDDTSDIASGVTIAWTPSEADSAISVGGVGSDEITVAEAGKYLVMVELSFEDNSADGVDVDNAFSAFLTVGGVARPRQAVGTVRGENGAKFDSVFHADLLNLVPGQILRVQTQRQNGTDPITLRAGESSLTVLRVGGKTPLLAAQSIRELTDVPSSFAGLGAHLFAVKQDETGVEFVNLSALGVDWGQLTSVPASFPADAHSHAFSEIPGLEPALNAKADLVGGEIPTSQIPAIALGEVFNEPDLAGRDARLVAGTVQRGDTVVVTDRGDGHAASYMLGSGDAWIEIGSAGAVLSVNGQGGVVVLAKEDIGLGDVDNTPDADKPVSAPQAAALATKADLADLDATAKHAFTSLSTATTWTDQSVPAGASVQLTATAAHTLPDDLPDGWYRLVMVVRGVTPTLDPGNNSIVNKDGNAVDLGGQPGDLPGPAIYILQKRAGNLEIWNGS